MYSGKLALSPGTVTSVIHAANVLGVDAVEKAACDFFVRTLDSSSAFEAFIFAAEYATCG